MVLCRLLSVDILSVGCRIELKYPPIMCEICGDFSTLVKRSPNNCFPGLLGAYTFEIRSSLLLKRTWAVRKCP